jgi:hypothetical protein
LESIFTDPTTSAAYVVLSFFMPVVIMLVKQAGFPHSWNSLIALGIYIATGIGAALLSDIDLTIENIAPLAAVATVVGSAGYSLFWGALGAGDGSAMSLDQRVTSFTSFIKDE